MSFVNATPEYVAAAASDLAKIGTAINYANSAAAGATQVVQAAGADAVSTSIAQLFGVHAQIYQAISAQAALFHEQFVQLMSGGATQYADTEVVNAAPLQAAAQPVLGASTAATHALSAQQPLVGAAAQAGSLASGVPVPVTTAAAVTGTPAPAAVAGSAAPAAATVTPMAASAAGPAGSVAPANPANPAGPAATTPAHTASYAQAAPAAGASVTPDMSGPLGTSAPR